MTNLETFPATEREAFANACRRHGFIAADFYVLDHGAENGIRRISILRPETGVSLEYASGKGKCWSVAFEQDLEADVFGPAPE
ncbi:hypothetical protein UB46_38300 [Burkholderiaceae bacterium 16]|nr:hypothetical protein UB46_38300 [Burkholderiaceae bacterium 16]